MKELEEIKRYGKSGNNIRSDRVMLPMELFDKIVERIETLEEENKELKNDVRKKLITILDYHLKVEKLTDLAYRVRPVEHEGIEGRTWKEEVSEK